MHRMPPVLFVVLTLLLVACGNSTPQSTPTVSITSVEVSSSASYTLSGFAYDRAGIESVSYTLGGVTHPLTLDQQGRFSTSVTLSAGNNRIEVTARGKSGKEGKAEITVTYNPPPAEIAVSATSAPRGGTITITGQNLGTSGTVTVGGVEATVVEWSASQVTVTLSDDTPHGYQEIVVTSPSGQDAYRDFFVGVEYHGNGAGLQEFLDGLTRGTAVLLGDGTYDLDPEGGPDPDGISFIINNHSLYGRGAGSTILTAATGGIVLFVASGEEIDLVDLSIETDAFLMANGAYEVLGSLSQPTTLGVREHEFVMSSPSQTATSRRHRSDDRPARVLTREDAERVLTLSLPDFQDAELSPLRGAAHPSVRLAGVALTEVTEGGGVIATVPEVFNGSVHLDDFAFTGGNAFLATTYDLRVDRESALDAVSMLVASTRGAITLSDASILVEEYFAATGVVGLEVIDSMVIATGEYGEISLASADLMAGSPLFQAGPVTVTGSTVEARGVESYLAIGSLGSSVMLEDNTLRAGEEMQIGAITSFGGGGHITLRDNEAVVGTFLADVADPADAVAGSLMIMVLNVESLGSTSLDRAFMNNVTLDGNDFTASSQIRVTISEDDGGDLIVRNNSFAAGDGDGGGELVLEAGNPGTLVLEGNHIRANEHVGGAALNLNGRTAVVRDNDVLIGEFDGYRWFNLELEEGSCDISNNRVSLLATSDAVNTDYGDVYIVCVGQLDSAAGHSQILEGNQFFAADYGDSYVEVEIVGYGAYVAGNEMVAGGEVSFYLAGEAEFAAGNRFETGRTEDSDRTEFHLGYSNHLNEYHPTTVTVDQAVLTGGPLAVYGRYDTETEISLTGLEVSLTVPFGTGLWIDGNVEVTATGNRFTVDGEPKGEAIGLRVDSEEELALHATGNTFTGFERALYVEDDSGDGSGTITARINQNVFDFEMTDPGDVADLYGVSDEIDATHNRWGGFTDAAAVSALVQLDTDTETYGGKVLIDPITQP